MKTRLTIALPALFWGLTLIVFAPQAFAQGPHPVQYISPRPGATLVSPGTTIAIRHGDPIDARTVNAALFAVTGTKTGKHSGTAVLADDGKTVIFKPQQPFAPGEVVQVTLNNGIQTRSGSRLDISTFKFTISGRQGKAPAPESFLLPEERAIITPTVPAKPRFSAAPRYLTLASDFPPLNITTPASGTGDGYLFTAPFPADYLIILDNSGQPVYAQKMQSQALDFKKQPTGVLTYWQNGTFYALDNSYNVVNTYTAGNGYTADVHDLQLIANGHALLLAYDSQIMDMSQIVPGGQPNAAVVGLIVQEIDAFKNVVFEWRSWDHFQVTDSQINLTTSRVDYVHGNAVEQDYDGNILISSRHMSEITKINRQTGDIIWRLGGNNNQFTFVGDIPPYFAFQHDIRRLPNGDITLFDNRTNLTPNYSRAVEYQLDETAMVATQVWQYRNTPDTYSAAMGDVQTLPNGNRVIGWGTGSLITEIKPNGTKAFEVALSPNLDYRAFRFPWHGYPTTQPLLIAQVQPTSVTLTYSWNGATDIASYRVYGGNQPHPTTLIATPSKTGFETQTVVTKNPTDCLFFRVMPIDLNGWQTQYSNEVAICQTFLPSIGR